MLYRFENQCIFLKVSIVLVSLLGISLNIIHAFLGIGAVISGFVLIRRGLRSTNVAIGILQLVAGIMLLVGGAYTMVSAMA